MKLLDYILKYWQLYALLVGITMTYAAVVAKQQTMETELVGLRTEVKELREEVKHTQVAQSDVRAQLSQIQTDLKWIMLRLEKL